ncbi:MAG TPA: Sip1-related alpha-galactosidase [Sphingomonas sp.]|jgi:hypothetical protein|uniref:Sip1-related alpha-galactosidase n=1 Tax=Sphingomonas sp. TaxID=28214 RepID=UPI002ED84FD3
MTTRRAILKTGLAVPALSAATTLAAAPTVALRSDGRIRFAGARAIGAGRITIAAAAEAGVQIVTLTDTGGGSLPAEGEIGVTFDAVPELREGVQLWRYAPWKAWTRPIAVAKPADLREDDIQFLYWRDRDGLYGAAVPLSGAGFRTTIGRIGGRMAARSMAGAAATIPETLPLLAIGHGRDPHAVMAATYRAALAAMGRSENEASRKRLPEALGYLGWNSWNASNLGNDLDEGLLLAAAGKLRGAGVPVGWMLVDDGYFDHQDQRLRSFAPNPAKFPNGFPALIARLKREHGVRYVGAWMALDGYWHGIDPGSSLGQSYAADLFTWSERRDVLDPAAPVRTNSFVRPDRPAMARYYDAHVAALKAHGFDFLKVDNQLVVERMAKGNFPVWTLGTAMHAGLNAAAQNHFDGAVINCMDMTADAYFNFGMTPVARAVEDYFPWKPDETYDLEKGNAAAHVAQALHNNLYFAQMVVPDFDMFETTNPNARLHAVARAANNGPIYVTDMPGKHDIALLKSLALADGRTLRADAPLIPCRDCLFQIQGAQPFKAFSRVGEAGLLAVFNLADAERVTGGFTAADVPGMDDATIAYEHVGGRLEMLGRGRTVPLSLARFGAECWSLHRAADGFAAFGRSDKINGVAAVARIVRAKDGIAVTLKEVGPMAAYVERRPQGVTMDGRAVPFRWTAGLLQVAAAETGKAGTILIATAA